MQRAVCCRRRSPDRGRVRRPAGAAGRSEEHTSELQSHVNLVCRLLLEKKKTIDMSGTEIESTQNSDGTATHHGYTCPMHAHAFPYSHRCVIESVEVNGTQINAIHYHDT